jgi:hypothetical protein
MRNIELNMEINTDRIDDMFLALFDWIDELGVKFYKLFSRQ